MDKLLPCPFCGVVATLLKTELGFPNTEYFIVYCEACPAKMNPFEDAKGAIIAWNTRTGGG